MQNNMIGEGAYGGLGGASLQGFYGYDQTQPINSSLGLGNAPNRDEMGISGLWVTEPQGGMGQDNTHGSLTLENMAFDDNAHASALSSAPSSTLVQLLHPTYELPGARPDDECGQQWPQATDTNLEPVSGVLDTAVVNATSQSLAEFPAQPFQGWNYQDSDGISEANTFAASTSAHEGLELLFSTPSNPARYSAPPGLNDRAYSAIHQLQPKPRAAGASTLSSDAVLSVTQVHTPLSTLSPPATSNALGAPFASARVSLSRRTGQYHGNGEARRRESAVERQRRLDARRFEQRQRFREEPGSTLAYSQDNVKPHHGPNKRRRTGHA